MNVTLFHYFLFSFEKTRLPAYCLKPTPRDCTVVKSVFRPIPLTSYRHLRTLFRASVQRDWAALAEMGRAPCDHRG